MNHDIQETLAYAKHLLTEHRRVQELVRDVEHQWSLISGGPQQPKVIAALRDRLEELRVELAKHFDEEEAGGVLEEAAARCPDLGREEMRLEELHPALLAELDQIVAGIRKATDVGMVPGELKDAFKQFSTRLKAHEASENRLLEKGFQVDLS